MNRKRGVNNSENKLLYDPNQRKQRRLGAFSMEEEIREQEENNEDLSQDDSIQDDEFNTSKQDSQQFDNEQEQNTSNGVGGAVKNAASSAKNVASNAAKNATKQAGKAVAKVASALAKKFVAFLLANPWVLLILGIALVILIIILIIAGDSEANGSGYFDTQCNFNESVVSLSTCNSEEVTEMPLDKYVIGATYSLAVGNDYSDETLKALLIVAKTNALANGGYNSSSKDLTLDDCSIPFIEVTDNDLYNNISDLYTDVENNLYISSSYDSTISTLSSSNALLLNSTIANEMEVLASEKNSYSTILDNIYNNDENINQNSASGTIYVGDSRMQGMLISGAIDSSNTIYGVGLGYNWFMGNGTFSSSNTNATSGAINAVNSIISGKTYNIVIWLGVNDYTYVSAEQYYNAYYDLATGDWKNQNIYIVAVGPVDDNLASNVDNAGINNFNSEMRSLIANTNVTNLHYISLNYSIQSYDNAGLHYSNDDYSNIHQQIINNITISSGNTDYAIYDMADYCTYYNVTENDAYWWPIGSTTATNGNIYGGNPSTTYVSSGYGPRVVSGVSGFHRGVDIAAACNENVIIATKAGTVTTVNDTCPSYGSYGSSCGGGYGNYVMVDHGDGTSSVYAHMYSNSIVVSVGDKVQQGEKIGMMGSSGSSTGCHLHFEIRINDSQVDPLDYISADNPRPVVRNITINAGDTGGQQAVCLALLDSGFSENATIGIMVNINAESGFRTDAVEYASGYTIDNIYNVSADEAAGFGLFQWSFGRRINVIDYARNNGMSPTSLQAQLEYFVYELENSYPVTRKYVTGNYSAYDIATNFCLDFERPANKSTTCPNRATTYVQMFTNYVRNGCN